MRTPSQTAFDAYHKWLGIPPKDQPPNHYRLLAIELFESDVEVIEAAANRQMAYVQQRATGEHIAVSQKLLNELSAARVCLLDPRKKAAYDAKLKAARSSPPAANPAPVIGTTGIERLLAEEQEGLRRQAQLTAARPRGPDQRTAAPSLRPTTPMELPAADVGSVPAFQGKKYQKRKSRLPWATINVAGAAIAVLLIGLLILKTVIEREIARKPPDESTTRSRARSEAEPKKAPPMSEWLPLGEAKKLFQPDPRQEEPYRQDRRQQRQFPPNRPPVTVRRIPPHDDLTVVVRDARVFNEKMANHFPVAQNKAGKGTLMTPSQPGKWPSNDVFLGSRTGRACELRRPGAFFATWSEPPTGRYILIFASTENNGAGAPTPWGEVAILVNGGKPTRFQGMASQTVAVVDLGEAIPIQRVMIFLHGFEHNAPNPGIAGVEIH